MLDQTSTRPPGTLAWLRRVHADHGRKHLPSYLGAMAFLAVSGGATAAAAWMFKPILNHMVEGEAFKELRFLSWAVLGLFTIRGLATFGGQVLLARAGTRIVADVQNRLFSHLLRQDMRFFNDRHSSEFMSRLALAANNVRDSVQVVAMSLGRDLLTAIALIAVMIIQDPLLAAIALVSLPVAAIVLGRMIIKIRKYARRSLQGSTKILEIMQESVLGARIVKSFNLEGLMGARMAAAVRDVERAANRMAVGGAIASPVSDVLAGFAIGAVIFYGSWRITIHGADAGSFFSFVAALLLAYDPCKRLARVNIDLQNTLVGVRMIYEILDRPAPEADQTSLPGLAVTEGRIVIENVRFSYRPGEPVLDGVDFVAAPNATTALVGPSGGGKSTIISLIQRFYEVDSGRILIDGQDISGVDLHSLRDRIAFVSQDVFLFRGTIRENIALGKPGATHEEIVAAAVKAHAHDFIESFASGYDTQTGEQGAQLSGGQRQRIAIARAILKDAPIILLDEPTAALDSESEREVQKALEDLRVGRTTVIVAHRLQTIVNADLICVIENGKAVEFGAHADLIARDGTYRNFFATQFGDLGPGFADVEAD